MIQRAVVVLAAGKGTRMRSDLPKALLPICGQPMLGFLLETVQALRVSRTLVVAGYQMGSMREYLKKKHAETVWQKEQLGSGHAVLQAASALKNFSGQVLVVYCDTPLLRTETLEALWKKHQTAGALATLLTVKLVDPTGYGRIRRAKDGALEKIVEENSATTEEKAIKEINVGCYIFDSKKLFQALRLVEKDERKKEYYLTDVVEILSRAGRIESLEVQDQEEVLGANTRVELSRLEGLMQNNILDRWIERGVEIRDPKSTVIDARVKIGVGTKILPHTVIEDTCVIGKGCQIGPFARIRGGSVIGDESVIGNFVEVVRSTIGKKTQVKHLSYLGDATVGSGVNVGAGSITANFDGKKKHRTVIEDRAQIGSGTILVAPVTVGRGAKTGAGAVIPKGKNVAPHRVVVGVPAQLLGKGR